MVKLKAASSKKPKRGVDFKKIKRKIGRKLPPPRNSTNTQIKSKAIVLPEQSLALERTGLAVNKKGLTLRELLQQTSHHNAKIRKAALNGIRDLVLKYPSELKLHKLTIIEKLRERICDTDKMVRETLYHLLKTVIFPCSKEDITGPVISLMMAYVFNAMTHMAVDIRLMAFKFFELIVLSYPSSFLLYAEKVLDNYIDIFENNQIYLQDKSKLKTALSGLVRCLSLLPKQKGEDIASSDLNTVEKRCLHAFEAELPKTRTESSFIMKKLEDLVPILVECFQESALLIRSVPTMDTLSSECMLCTLQCINLAVKVYVNEMNNYYSGGGIRSESSGSDGINMLLILLKKLWQAFPIGELQHFAHKETDIYFILNVRITEIFLHLGECIGDSTVLVEKFLEFIETLLLGQISNNIQSNRLSIERQLISLIPFIPGLVSKVTIDWKIRLLEAFTAAFRECRVESKLSLAYLSAIEKMLLPVKDQTAISLRSFPDILVYWTAWVQELPRFLLQLGDKHPSISKVVLKLQLQVGQCTSLSSPLSLEYHHLQGPLKEFYRIQIVAGSTHYGPFVKLPSDCQELAICCLYYFTTLNPDMLESLAYCCLCDNLEPHTKLRIIEVLHSAYKAGHVKISEHISFLVTLVARLRVLPEKLHVDENDGEFSSRGIFQSITRYVCSCLSQIGDKSLVLKLIYKNIFNQVTLKLPVDNMRGLLIVILTLYTKSTILLDEEIRNISSWLSNYLIEATSCIPESIDATIHSDRIHLFQYFVHPCVVLFYGNDKVLSHVLKLLDAQIMEYEVSLASPCDVGCVLEARRVHAVISILTFIHNDVKLQRSLSSSKEAVLHILQSLHKLLASSNFTLTLEERHKIDTAFHRLKARACDRHCWSGSDLEGI